MRKALLAACVLGLLWPAVAGAHTVIDCSAGCSLPYQAWVDAARVPTPDVTLAVVENVDACADALGCTDGSTVYIAAWQTVKPRFTFLHELGHVFAREHGLDFMDENFADEYAYCARLGPAHIKPRWSLVGHIALSGRMVLGTCREVVTLAG